MKDVRKRGPEAVTWDQLKGQPVQVWMLGGGDNVAGRLVWVDRFSIGVEQTRPIAVGGTGCGASATAKIKQILIIHKGPGLVVCPDPTAKPSEG